MAAPASFDLNRDIVHDAQFDYYGKLLATASSDRVVRIYAVGPSMGPEEAEQQQTLIKELKGHEGPVWGVAWAHPKFGNVLASCSYDRNVIVWQEQAAGEWVQIYRHSHSLSANSVAWAPHELGLCLASGSSDGKIQVVQLQPEQAAWGHLNHAVGVHAVSWGPPFLTSAAFAPSDSVPELVMQLASAGADHTVKIWTKSAKETEWSEQRLEGHKSEVRDVAWAPNIGVPHETVASCSADEVIIWTRSASAPSPSSSSSASSDWSSTRLPISLSPAFPTIWSVSWSTTGNLLAVTSGEDQVSIWKANTLGEWKQVGSLPSADSSSSSSS